MKATKRKTPCQGHGKPHSATVAMECPGCGEWNNVNGKWMRPYSSNGWTPEQFWTPTTNEMLRKAN